jgi:hypothetical protein
MFKNTVKHSEERVKGKVKVKHAMKAYWGVEV